MLNTKTLAEQINAIEFDHPFTLHPDGTITDPPGVYAPSVYHNDETDVGVSDPAWHPLTGMTSQYGYHGAVMHPSEYIGRGIAEYLLELAADEPRTFVVTAVECWPTEDDPEPEPAGWAILMKEQPCT